MSLHFARIKQQNKPNWRMFVIGYCKHHALRNTYYSEVAVTHVRGKCILLKVLLLFVYSIFMSKQLNINNFCIAEVGRRKTTDFSFGFSLHIHLQIFILTISFSFFFLLLPLYTILNFFLNSSLLFPISYFVSVFPIHLHFSKNDLALFQHLFLPLHLVLGPHLLFVLLVF